MKTIQLPQNFLRRKSKETESLTCDPACPTVVEQQSEEACSTVPAQEKRKHMLKLPGILKKKIGKKHQKEGISDTPDTPVSLDFSQNLEQNLLAEASQQLIAQEERLFSPQSSDEQVTVTEDEMNNLEKDYEIFMFHLRKAVDDSFNTENQEVLRSAVKAMLQQEEQDRRWVEAAEGIPPCWRPLKCREIHDLLLKDIIHARLHKANEEQNGVDKLSTSLKKEVFQMGMHIKKDLLQIIKNVQQCYTSEFDICNMYLMLYHQAFSTKLLEIARTNIEIQDCIYILSWIHVYYPKDILHHDEIEPYINTETLEALLPEEDRKSLEEQCMSHTEAEVKKWLSNALKKEEETCQTNNKPELIDGFYFSNLALDVIPIINGAMKNIVDIFGNRDNAQKILLQMEELLLSYKKLIDELIKKRPAHISEILKGNLVSIEQLREYIEKQEDLSDEVKKAWLSIVSEIRNSCHSYFLSPIHKDLKELYRKLWTLAWFSESHTIIGDIIKYLEDVVQNFSDIQTACKKALLNQLHSEVMIEYMKRMLKGKLKLKDKNEQETAACSLCEDSARINSLFVRMGSKEEWLSSILPKVSEVLRLQDPGALQLEIVTLARTYPDISECQVLALLHLKTNLSKTDVRTIKKSLTDNRDSQNNEPTTAFFSKVPVKRKLMAVFNS